MSKQNRDLSRTERAAAELEAERRRNRNRQLLTVGGVVVALLLIVGGGFYIQRSQDPTGSTVTAAASGASEVSLTVGPEDAPHTVVIYEDFLCPFCMEFEAASRDDLAQLAADGQVKVDYRPLDFLSRFGDYSLRSTNAFAAVLANDGPETAKAFHDALFENQPSESGPFPEDSELVELGVDAGADEAALQSAVDDLTYETAVADATDAASRAGINATPTILLDGEPFNEGGTVDELAANLVAQLQ